MFNKVWVALKYFFIAIGIISSAIILYIILTVVMNKNAPNDDQESKPPVEIYSTDNSGINLKVSRDDSNEARLLVSITKDGQQLINNYELPQKLYDPYELKITDTKVIPLQNNEYGIVFISTNEECDHCDNSSQIWLFKLNNKMNFVKMLTLLEMHKLDSGNAHILASRSIQLPYLENTPSVHITIPLNIEIGKKIKITPMLDQKSIELFKQHFGKIINDRLEKLSDSNNPNLLEEYKASQTEFNESLIPQVISY